MGLFGKAHNNLMGILDASNSLLRDVNASRIGRDVRKMRENQEAELELMQTNQSHNQKQTDVKNEKTQTEKSRYSGETTVRVLQNQKGGYEKPSIKYKKLDKDEKRHIKVLCIMLGCATLFVVGFTAIVSISSAVRCGSYNKLEDIPTYEHSLCKEKVAELQAEKTSKEEKAKEECPAKGYKWNTINGRCNTDAEQEEANKKKAEEEVKEEAKRQEAEAKKAEEEARKREEESKYVTYTGTDGDANDYAGKYDALWNVCWDILEEKVGSPFMSVLDTRDGPYPVNISMTVSGDGSLVRGSMKGYFLYARRSVFGKFKEYAVYYFDCNYSNGTTSLDYSVTPLEYNA